MKVGLFTNKNEKSSKLQVTTLIWRPSIPGKLHTRAPFSRNSPRDVVDYSWRMSFFLKCWIPSCAGYECCCSYYAYTMYRAYLRPTCISSYLKPTLFYYECHNMLLRNISYSFSSLLVPINFLSTFKSYNSLTDWFYWINFSDLPFFSWSPNF